MEHRKVPRVPPPSGWIWLHNFRGAGWRWHVDCTSLVRFRRTDLSRPRLIWSAQTTMVKCLVRVNAHDARLTPHFARRPCCRPHTQCYVLWAPGSRRQQQLHPSPTRNTQLRDHTRSKWTLGAAHGPGVGHISRVSGRSMDADGDGDGEWQPRHDPSGALTIQRDRGSRVRTFCLTM